MDSISELVQKISVMETELGLLKKQLEKLLVHQAKGLKKQGFTPDMFE